MDPQAVSGLQAGDFSDGQRGTGTLNPHFYLGPDEIEGCIFGARRNRKCQGY
jgi:hypothetical protein